MTGSTRARRSRPSIRDSKRVIRLTAILTAILLVCLQLCTAQENPNPQAPAIAAPASLLDDARVAVATSNFERARTQLETFLIGNPGSAEGHFLLAYSLLRLNNPKASLAEYNHAARLRAPSAEELRYVAEDYALLDDYADAERWMQQSLQMNAQDADTWYGLGRIQYTLQKVPQAVESFEKALTLAPRSVKIENNLALALEDMNREEDAIAAYRRALEWQRESSHPSEQPMVNLAIILIRKGNLEEAESLLAQAVAIAPGDARIRAQLGHIYLKQEHFDKAQIQFEHAIALAPDNASFHFLLGRVYRYEGMKEKADAEFALASKLNGGKTATADP